MAANNNDTFFDKLFTNFNFYEAGMNAHKKNVAAINNINQLMVEYFRTVSKRQQQLVQESVDDFNKAFAEFMNQATPQQKLSDQTALTKKAYEKIVANAGEFAEMSSKSSREAFDIMTKRTSEILEEIKKEVEKMNKAA